MRRAIPLSTLAALAAALPATAHAADDVGVCNSSYTSCTGCTFATVGAAVAAASPGQHIMIRENSSVLDPGPVLFEKDLVVEPANLECDGPFTGSTDYPSTLRTNSGRLWILNKGSQVIVKNLRLMGGVDPNGGSVAVFAESQLAAFGVKFDGGSAGFGENACGGVLYAEGGSFINLFSQDGRRTWVQDGIGATSGGGICALASSVTLTGDVWVVDNQADQGGGIFLSVGDMYALPKSGARPLLRGNRAEDGSGGGIFAILSDLTLSDADIGAYAYPTTGCSEFLPVNTASEDGGGVFAHASDVFIGSDTRFCGNHAGLSLTTSGDGGGIAVLGGQLDDVGGRYEKNSANGHGGGVAVLGAASTFDLAVFDGNIANNATGDASGGGLYVSGDDDVTITDSEFTRNDADFGGNIGVDADPGVLVDIAGGSITRGSSTQDGAGVALTSGDVRIQDVSEIWFNVSNGHGGGIAVYGDSDATLELIDVAIWENSALGFGGGLRVAGDGTSQPVVVLRDVQIFENTAVSRGAGIDISDATLRTGAFGTTLDGLWACNGPCLTLETNLSGSYGGGLSARNGANVDVARAIVHDNDATGPGNGVAIDSSATVQLFDTLVTYNTGTGGPVVAAVATKSGGSVTLHHTTISGNAGYGVSTAAAGTTSLVNSIVYNNGFGNLSGSGTVTQSCALVGVDPLFVDPLGNDFHLQTSPIASPAIDACTTGLAHPSEVDLDGVARTLPLTQGAYEH